MRKKTFIALIIGNTFLFLTSFFLITHPAKAVTTNPTCLQTLGAWQSRTPAPNNHIEGASAEVDGKLYLFTGFATAQLVPNTVVDIYDPATDTWQTAPTPMPFAASHIQAATDGRYVWLAGGFLGQSPGPPTDAVWRYDTLTDTWSLGPPLPARRASGALVRNGRNLHFIGGLSDDRQTDQADHWLLNLDNPVAWQTAPPMPTPRNHFQAVAIDGVIYAVGGQFGHDGPLPVDLNILDAFYPATNTWHTLAPMLSPRSHAEAGTFILNDRIMVMGGRNNQVEWQIQETTAEYNPQTNSWQEMILLPTRLISPAATIVGDYVVLTSGGYTWNEPSLETWVSPLTSNCQTEPIWSPILPPADLNTSATDWGDLPDNYNTTLSANGASHIIQPDLRLGQAVDSENNGTPSPAADGDSNDDGVTLPVFELGATVPILVNAVNLPGGVGNAYLQGWIDLNQDSDFSDPNEQLFTNLPVNDGFSGPIFTTPPYTAFLTVPTTLDNGDILYLRFRLSTSPDLPPIGAAPNGEVEDYRIIIGAENPANLPAHPILTDPALSKIGILQPGSLGLPGEQLLWIITFTNPSTIPLTNITITDSIQPELRIDQADINHGTVTVSGQLVTFTIFTLQPGESLKARIYTTVLSSPLDGQFINTAITNTGERATAIVDGVTSLPNTGYP